MRETKYKRRRFKLLKDTPDANKGDIYIEGLEPLKGKPIPNKDTLYLETSSVNELAMIEIFNYKERVKNFNEWFKEVEPFEFYL